MLGACRAWRCGGWSRSASRLSAHGYRRSDHRPCVRGVGQPALKPRGEKFADAFDCVVCYYQAVSLRALDLRGNPQSGAHSPIAVISAIQARYSGDDHTHGWMLIHVRWRTVHRLGIRYGL